MRKFAINAFIGVGMLLLLLSIYMHFKMGYYGDKQWQLLYARMWLDGKQLYKGIFPVSLPLIFWIYALPASLSDFTSDYKILTLLGLWAVAFSVFLSVRLIALHPGFANDRAKQWQFGALLCFVLIFRTNQAFFADREHLFLVLALPYLLRLMPGLSDKPLPRWLTILVGLAAGLGFCLKPHCIIIFVGAQLVTIVRMRSLRILISRENLIIYAVGALYAAIVAYFFTDYITTVVPMAFATYSAIRDENSFWVYGGNAVSVLLLALLMFRPRLTSPYRAAIYYWLALCPFFFFYALANNNWPYTYYPLSSVALILTGFLLWEFLYFFQEYRAQGKATWPFIIGAVACSANFLLRVVTTCTYIYGVAGIDCYNKPECYVDTPFLNELKDTPALHTFGAISIDFERWTRLSRYEGYGGAVWQTRFPQLWMLPQFFVKDTTFMQDHKWILDYVAHGFADDLNARKPEVLFVDDTNKFYTAHRVVNLVKLFSADAQFREAMTHYRYIHTIDICRNPNDPYKFQCRYEIYRLIH